MVSLTTSMRNKNLIYSSHIKHALKYTFNIHIIHVNKNQKYRSRTR